MSDRSFEIYLPAGAEILASTARSGTGMAVNSAPVPTGEKNRYAFIFPLRPGETRFQIPYRLVGATFPAPIPLSVSVARGVRSIAFTVEHGGVRVDVRVPLLPGTRWPGVPWWVGVDISGGLTRRRNAGNDRTTPA
jgi:hypothetical protein